MSETDNDTVEGTHHLQAIQSTTGFDAWLEVVEDYDGFRIWHVRADTALGVVGACGDTFVEAAEALEASLRGRGLWKNAVLS